MALISCSECGKEVSDKAAACPGCGAPIAAIAIAAPQAPPRAVVVPARVQIDNKRIRVERAGWVWEAGGAVVLIIGLVAAIAGAGGFGGFLMFAGFVIFMIGRFID